MLPLHTLKSIPELDLKQENSHKIFVFNFQIAARLVLKYRGQWFTNNVLI
jgi:hypothetical protein